jgi:periplasmic protein TonB
MTAGTLSRPPLDDPGQRLLWILPVAIVAWLFMLSGFALLLGERSAPQQAALEAQIIELPPPAPILPQGAAKPAPKPAMIKPAPMHHESVHLKKLAPTRATIATPKVALPPEPSAPTAGGGAATGSPNPPEGAGIGSESNPNGSEGGLGSGPGTDSSGARAIFAPTPVIPDDLREDTLQAEAVARFTVLSDGTVTVILIKPTPNPRINQLLLDTLAKWQFFPAVRGGDAIDSTFDVRIPITVR